MMAGPGTELPAGGGPARHIPVLLEEVLKALAPFEGARVVDATFGAGGYTRALLERGASVVAIDRDPDAIAAGRALEERMGGRLKLVEGRFSRLSEHAGRVDGVVLDIGVSSMQLDEAGRGFSFRHKGPLDMRMERSGPSAADVVNRYKAGDLARIFRFYGEERHAGRIARMIERRRQERPFTHTLELAEAIQATIGLNPKERIHPATRVFQALRIYVNDELGELVQALFCAERALVPGGRLAVVSFHSLEDRIVKRFLAERSGRAAGSRHMPEAPQVPATFPINRGPILASAEEANVNPRARSAKLRTAVRSDLSPSTPDASIFRLPDLPRLQSSQKGR